MVEPTVDIGLHVGEIVERCADAVRRRRDEFHQRLGIIGGDVRMRQRRTERRRVRRECDPAQCRNAQAFLFQAKEALVQQLNIGFAGEPGKPALDRIEQG